MGGMKNGCLLKDATQVLLLIAKVKYESWLKIPVITITTAVLITGKQLGLVVRKLRS